VLDLPELVKFGAIYDLEQQALLYSAADLFVGPSLEEAFGQVYIEAAACGTPSICYPVDGAPEAVIDGIVGRVAKNVGPDALADAIMELYSNHQLRTNLGWWGRYHVASEFSLEASCRTLFFAFREAIRLAGGDLEPKLKISPKPPQMPPVKVLLEPLTSENLGSVDRLSPDQFDVVLADYYQQQVKSFRGRSTPWWLKPKAWLARINRNNLRKKIASNARKRKTASDHAKKNLKSD
jgi:Glycosyl transferases group 1